MIETRRQLSLYMADLYFCIASSSSAALTLCLNFFNRQSRMDAASFFYGILLSRAVDIYFQV